MISDDPFHKYCSHKYIHYVILILNSKLNVMKARTRYLQPLTDIF